MEVFNKKDNVKRKILRKLAKDALSKIKDFLTSYMLFVLASKEMMLMVTSRWRK